MEHFPVPYRWYLRVIQMCIRTKLDRLMIHILLQGKVVLSRHFLCTLYQAPVAWSNLPLATKSCKTVKSFNYQVKKYYINTY